MRHGIMVSVSIGLLVVLSFGLNACQDVAVPAPGSRGNADNVPYIGKSDPNKNPVRLAKATGHVSNYDESKVANYILPDPLRMTDGTLVATPEQWRQRRKEILEFYREEIYGHVPTNAPAVIWTAQEVQRDPDHPRTTQIVHGKVGTANDLPKIVLTLSRPTEVQGPRPVLLSLTFSFPNRPASPTSAPSPTALPPALQACLDRGWSYASINYTDIQPDQANKASEGVIGLTQGKDASLPANAWGGISAWSWGMQRAVDYLSQDATIDAKKICITGTSRLGKTVLWTAAQDDRIAAVFACVPGEMGASLIRRDWGETLDDMAQNFPWQFCGNLPRWAGRWNDLPVDQHHLIACIAPRAVYINGGLTDQWSDPKGEFLAMVAAGPVYRLLGARDLGTDQLPNLDQPIVDGSLGFHYHSGGHGASPKDWTLFLQFAERNFSSETTP